MERHLRAAALVLLAFVAVSFPTRSYGASGVRAPDALATQLSPASAERPTVVVGDLLLSPSGLPFVPLVTNTSPAADADLLARGVTQLRNGDGSRTKNPKKSKSKKKKATPAKTKKKKR